MAYLLSDRLIESIAIAVGDGVRVRPNAEKSLVATMLVEFGLNYDVAGVILGIEKEVEESEMKAWQDKFDSLCSDYVAQRDAMARVVGRDDLVGKKIE
jgi:hypothetical protein